MYTRIKQNMTMNTRIKQIIEIAIIIWIVADIIILTTLYFVDIPNLGLDIVIFDTLLCVVLFAQFIFRLNSKEDKKQYIRNNKKKVVVDIVSMIPYELLVLGPFGFLKLLRLLRILTLFEKGREDIFEFLQKNRVNYLIFTFIVLMCAGSITILVMEGSPNDKINDPLDAAWYVMTTISTVGYGDVYPESVGGRIFGIILMIVGVAFFSFLTATFSSWFMRDIETEEEEILERVKGMEKSMKEMKSEMEKMRHEMLAEINELKEIIKKSK